MMEVSPDLIEHIGNVLKSKEVNEKSNVQRMHISAFEIPVTQCLIIEVITAYNIALY